MKSAKDLLKEMGFNSDAPHSTQKAFLKNLIRSAQIEQKAEVIDLEKKSPNPTAEPQEIQLSFDLSKLSS